ncbi:hypothetical protein CPC08DRAFT_715647 [Agrocybe pediades]|nr:hypothetical protein CPC08DRAFT_715647 [Agrocybe pediades]
MGSVHDTIALFTSNISGHILQLALEDRQTLTALLKWDPTVSGRLTRALQFVESPWHRLSFEEEYFFILRDLERSIQQAPLIWADVASINIRLDSLSARISQGAPRLHSPMGHLRGANSTETSLFHNAQQVMIMGGSFTIHSQNAQGTIAPASSPPPQSVEDLATNESIGQDILCPLRRILAYVMRVIRRTIHGVKRALRTGGRCT